MFVDGALFTSKHSKTCPCHVRGVTETSLHRLLCSSNQPGQPPQPACTAVHPSPSQTALTCSHSQRSGREVIFFPGHCHAVRKEWRTPPCCKRASNVQPELLCNPPPSLGKEAATGKGRSYRARGGGSDLRWRRGSGLGGGEGEGPTELLPSGGETVTGDVQGGKLKPGQSSKCMK